MAHRTPVAGYVDHPTGARWSTRYKSQTNNVTITQNVFKEHLMLNKHFAFTKKSYCSMKINTMLKLLIDAFLAGFLGPAFGIGTRAEGETYLSADGNTPAVGDWLAGLAETSSVTRSVSCSAALAASKDGTGLSVDSDGAKSLSVCLVEVSGVARSVSCNVRVI